MKKVVGVGSVKGGVGKTLVALNLAKALSKHGRVALIDADMDNSSFSTFTGTNAAISVTEDQRFKPYVWDGIQVFSMSLIGSKTQSVSMESSRYTQILDDAIERSLWEAEYFVFDLPGGSSEEFRSVVAIMGENLVGDIIVCQPLMTDATEKFLHLHDYFEIPVLGLIENMAYFECPDHEQPKRYHPFGDSTADGLAERYGVEVLGKIPLSEKITENVAKGNPVFPEEFQGPIEAACKKVMSSEVKAPGFFTRMKERVEERLKGEVEKILVNFIVEANKALNINKLRTDAGFRDGKPFLFVITDESGDTELTRVALRVTEDRLKVLRNPENLDFQIATDFRTLARMIMGQARRRGEIVPFDPMDAWFHGDLKIYGLGHTQYAVRAFRQLLGDEKTVNTLRARFGSVLKVWI